MSEAAGEVLGRKIAARLSGPEAEDKMQKLAQKFAKFDNFTVI